MLSRLRLPSLVVSLAVSLTAFASSASAQVCAPDGLDQGNCCQPAGVVLPTIPAISMTAKFLCFNNCSPQINANLCVDIGAPQAVGAGGALVCGIYTIRYQIRVCSTGAVIWTGSMRAHYSRNWQESSIPGAVNLGVWRFLLNGDLVPTVNLPPGNPCIRPVCVSTFGRAYFTGYIDYAFDCNTGTWAAAWGLTHECDAIHHPLGSARPAPAAGLHPTRSFTFVGPGAGFTVTNNIPPSQGTVVSEAVRWNNWAALPLICTFEERVLGTITVGTPFCFCSTAVAPQYIPTLLTGTGGCGTNFASSTASPFLQKRIGNWTNPAVFPGLEFLLFDLGRVTYASCIGITTTEWFEGVETLRGYPAFDYNGNPLPFTFEDIGSSNRAPNNMAVWIGAPHLSQFIMNLNAP